MKTRRIFWKASVALSIVLLSCAMSKHPVQAATVFFIGINNNTNTDFEQEGGGRNNNTYYWENGNYTAVTTFNGTTGAVWDKGQEIWQDGASDTTWANTVDGFARAITNSWTTHHIFFQLDPDEVGPGKTLTFTIDFLQPGQSQGNPQSSHTIAFYLDDILIHTEVELNTSKLIQVTGIDASSLEPGPHALSWVRTGGVAGWVSIDYLSLESVPEPSRAMLLTLAFGGMLLRRRRR